MRKKHRIMLVSLCAIMIVVSSVMLTLAYLTATTNDVKNTFTVGNVKFDKDLNKGLDEAKTNENGEPVDDEENKIDKESAPRVTKNKYKLVPGHTYTKDPTIHLDETSEDCYLFVKVVNGLTKSTKDSIEAATETTGDAPYKNIADQMRANGWYDIGNRYTDIYVYVGSTTGTDPKVVKASEKADYPVFENFKIDENITGEQLNKYVEKTEAGVIITNITITAYAVQADGFGGKNGSGIWDLVKGNFT